LFAGTGSTPEAITQFLSERAAQSLAVAQFMQIVEAFNGDITFGRMAELARQGMSYKGKIPDELFNAALPLFSGIQSLMAAGLPGDWRRASLEESFLGRKRTEQSNYEGQIARAAAGFVGGIGGTVSSSQLLGSEITRDTGTAESLLSVIQDSIANQIAIEENTRKTAENTSKALTLRPDRERSFIDVGRGYIQSLGQRLTNPALAAVAGMDRNIVLPGSIGMASGVATAARTLQERLTDAAEMNVRQNSEMIDILYDARTVLINMLAALDSDTSTINRLSVAEFDRIQSEVNRRRR
jgi:hypothetical protein